TKPSAVSNYPPPRPAEPASATGGLPAVNPIKWSPATFDRTILEGHRERGVVLEGYSPFRSADLDHPVLAGIAEAHGKTVPQVIVRWHLQHGIVVIPKSGRRERIISNADVGDFE